MPMQKSLSDSLRSPLRGRPLDVLRASRCVRRSPGRRVVISRTLRASNSDIVYTNIASTVTRQHSQRHHIPLWPAERRFVRHALNHSL